MHTVGQRFFRGVLLLSIVLASGRVAATQNAATISGTIASQQETRAGTLVRVRLYDSFGVPAHEFTSARREAGAILREARIEPLWLVCSNQTRLSASSARCELALEPDEVVVRILGSRLPKAVSEGGALGEALVDIETRTGSLATIFADRIGRVSHRAAANRSGVLGRVIAHEIGHLLLGTRDHAPRGLMRSVWKDEELRRPIGLEWLFSPAEARRMHAVIVERGM